MADYVTSRYILKHTQHETRPRSTQASLDEIEAAMDRVIRMMWDGSGLGPQDVDICNPYDGYAIMPRFWLEAVQWHGVQQGEAYAFYAGDISVGGPQPFNSSGGNLGNGRTLTAMWTDSIEQLRGTAGSRQVQVGAEIALARFGPPLRLMSACNEGPPECLSRLADHSIVGRVIMCQ
jgi:hypothetical protein